MIASYLTREDAQSMRNSSNIFAAVQAHLDSFLTIAMFPESLEACQKHLARGLMGSVKTLIVTSYVLDTSERHIHWLHKTGRPSRATFDRLGKTSEALAKIFTMLPHVESLKFTMDHVDRTAPIGWKYQDDVKAKEFCRDLDILAHSIPMIAMASIKSGTQIRRIICDQESISPEALQYQYGDLNPAFRHFIERLQHFAICPRLDHGEDFHFRLTNLSSSL